MVKIWEQDIIIPTYATGQPEKNPMFFEKRIYQGSSGAVYPNPIIEKIYDEKINKTYRAVFLENKYIRMMVLPALGGRIQMAFDKTGNRHFIYYNEVIKPALVGLCGPWISGGIEFNWPQHHRPSTFEPVDYLLKDNDDGSKTIWVNEIEKMFHTKGMAGFTLHPDKAYIEISVKLYNRTALPQTFLWWANPAVKVNDDYQSVFPPDVHAVFDHGKRDVSAFPIARGHYYKVDYAPGTDISRYKNIPVPTSYMAIHSAYDFVGGYEHDSQAGLLHVANHHVSPGKKQWTWGNGDFGKAWDRNLTDENGPYIELMTGVYTDNQPDFSWLMPYEQKSFTQYFLPYRQLGMVKNASKDILLHFSKDEEKVFIKIFATSVIEDLHIKLFYKNNVIYRRQTTVSPERLFAGEIDVSPHPEENDFILILYNKFEKEILRYQPSVVDKPVPAAAKAPLQPAEIKTNEELYLTGLHLEQYRHATYSPVNYYQEALRRNPADSRNNNALAIWHLRRGQFEKSEAHFRKAIETITQKNANPLDGESFYYLGVCLTLQQKNQEAYAAFYKATWNSAWQAESYFALARLDVQSGNFEAAMDHISRSLVRNGYNNKALALQAILYRKLQQHVQAKEACEQALQKDPFNLAILFEKSKHAVDAPATDYMQSAFNLARGDANTFIEYAIDFYQAGLYQEAIEWLCYYLSRLKDSPHPMILYCLAWMYDAAGAKHKANQYFLEATKLPTDYCFPNRVDEILMLRTALQYNKSDYKAWYYLGCLWYDKRQYDEAIECWMQTIKLNDLAAAYRNLGIAFFNKRKDEKTALEYFEKAFSLNTKDARILMELDYLYKRLNKPAGERLSFLDLHADTLQLRDDLYLERIALYNYLGMPQLAYQQLRDRKFHPWEGGEGKVSAQYRLGLIQMAVKKIDKQDFTGAVELLMQAQQYPENLGEGKLAGTQENEIFYWLGCAYEALQMTEDAAYYFDKATKGSSVPTAAIFYNDPQPDAIFYQGLSWEKLHFPEKAKAIFKNLVDYGQQHKEDKIELDYFAVSLPDLLIFEDDLDKRNQQHCLYMQGLGQLGLKKLDAARSSFDGVQAMNSMHQGAKLHKQMISRFELQKQ